MWQSSSQKIKIASIFNSQWKYDVKKVTFGSIHEGKKTYECKHCQKEFDEEENFKRHERKKSLDQIKVTSIYLIQSKTMKVLRSLKFKKVFTYRTHAIISRGFWLLKVSSNISRSIFSYLKVVCISQAASLTEV